MQLGAALRQCAAHQVGGSLGARFGGQAQHVLVPASAGGGQRPACQRLGCGVQVLHQPRGVGGDHGVADRMQGDLQALLLLQQRFFGLVPRGHEPHTVQCHGQMPSGGLHQCDLPGLGGPHTFLVAISAHAQCAHALVRHDQRHIDDGTVVQHGDHGLVGAWVGARVLHHHDVGGLHDFFEQRIPLHGDFHGLQLAAQGTFLTAGGVCEEVQHPRGFVNQGQPDVAVVKNTLSHGFDGIEHVGQGPGAFQAFAQLEQGLGVPALFGVVGRCGVGGQCHGTW